METIQVVLDTKLLKAVDRAGLRTKQNRSALIREALKQHLLRLELQSLEDLDRQGYARKPQSTDEPGFWESQALWPTELASHGFNLRTR